jgi:carbon monoxide dehydrogenase subunit G
VPLKTEETFKLQVPPERVWAYLIDPRQVVTCLPGAELTSVQDESTFLGKVKVKVGPVVAAYSGKVVITERDDAARVVRMVGEGRESAGGGSAKVLITSTVAALPGGGSEVRVTADLDIVGKIAQFGRGMIESVNKQMFRQFTECVRATLETDAPAALQTAPDSAMGHPASDSVNDVRAAADNATGFSGDAVEAPVLAPTLRTAAAQPPLATAQPVRLLPLIGRAIWESLVNLLRRLVGRRPTAPR